MGDATLRLLSSGPPCSDSTEDYSKRLLGASEYVRTFGFPEVLEFEMRDQARYVSTLDPDIACKTSWSMSVKIMTQRQRNYERNVERVMRSAWQQRGRSVVRKILGFEWPF